MPSRTPQEHLKDLHTELVATKPADSASQAALGQLTEDVRRTIDAGTTMSATDAYRGLRQRLADAAAAFQASHPELTAEIEGVLDTLSTHNL
jgi:Domain of unknown function (DUF4404)